MSEDSQFMRYLKAFDRKMMAASERLNAEIEKRPLMKAFSKAVDVVFSAETLVLAGGAYMSATTGNPFYLGAALTFVGVANYSNIKSGVKKAQSYLRNNKPS